LDPIHQDASRIDASEVIWAGRGGGYEQKEEWEGGEREGGEREGGEREGGERGGVSSSRRGLSTRPQAPAHHHHRHHHSPQQQHREQQHEKREKHEKNEKNENHERWAEEGRGRVSTTDADRTRNAALGQDHLATASAGVSQLKPYQRKWRPTRADVADKTHPFKIAEKTHPFTMRAELVAAEADVKDAISEGMEQIVEVRRTDCAHSVLQWYAMLTHSVPKTPC
jgi:hypothetical protein